MPTRIASPIASLLAALGLLLTLGSSPLTVAAAPMPTGSVALAQNVDWMSSDQASSLDLSFPVMVPTFIPAPFSGSPSVSGGGGSYSLYWVNYGGPPTFLRIEGVDGGSLPAGSPADLNNQLFINASVGGHDAIHDVTSIYDNVWWIAGGVLYSVSSHNMTGTDSLSLANALVALQPPVAPEPEPEPEPTAPAPTQAPRPTEAPVTAAPPAAQPTTNATTPAEGESGPLEEEPATDAGSVTVPTGPIGTPVADDGLGVGGTIDGVDEPGSTDAGIADAVASDLLTDTLASLSILGSVALQDGTGGADLPQAGDGTGGILEIAIP